MRINIVKLPLLFAFIIQIHNVKAQTRNEINIPNIPGYITLKCDFHMHTVFSDGLVWPTIRVNEAWRDGLDVISITDHINYRNPILKNHINIIDYNTPYNEAKLRAERLGITLIKGVEINRGVPPGHFNVLFAKDINDYTDEDFFKALRRAHNDGAFIQWNHPEYKQKGIPIWFDDVNHLYEDGLLNGIEVYNHNKLHDKALDWVNKKKLTIMCDSDVHELIDIIPSNLSHRPITLVFAKDNSIEAIKEALFERRTAAYFGNEIIGQHDILKQIFEASVNIIDLPTIVESLERFVQFKNNSDIDFDLELEEEVNGIKMPKTMRLKANKITLETMRVYNDKQIQTNSIIAKYAIKNLISISGEKVIVAFEFVKKEPIKEIKLIRITYPEVKYKKPN